MTLQHELGTLPPNAITILRFMENQPALASDYMDIRRATGLSDRAAGKAVKRLVTRFFMRMDESRMYHVTPKGEQAIDLLNSGFDPSGTVDEADTIPYDLCAVVPAQIIGDIPVKWMLGVNPASNELPEHPAELVLRITAEEGSIQPDQALLNISALESQAFEELTLIASGANDTVRIRIEAYQLLEMDEPNMAGGMYFDIPVSGPSTSMRAVHIPISIL